MTRIFRACAAAVVSLLFVCVCHAADGPENFVRVYYFHTNFRCVNCHNMEKWTKETVETDFKNELASGKLDYQVVNIETKGNEYFTQDYQLFTKSVVLSLVRGGKEVKFENLTKVWEYLQSEKKFCQYIKENIEKYLKEL